MFGCPCEFLVQRGHPGIFTEISLLLFQELKTVVQNVPEVADVVGSLYANRVLDINNQDGEEKVKAVFKSIFTQLMSASKDVISKAVSKLKSRLQMASQVDGNPVL